MSTGGVSYETRFFHAEGDGVSPALLLSAPKGAAQYLFNVPDGFARLALEHKLRPSAKLSCVLLTSLLPPAAGGLGGLLLRLAQDGHGQVQMIGSSGLGKLVHSFRHIFRWRHPKVLISECGADKNVPVFEDEYVVIVPIMSGASSLGCPWCRFGTMTSCREDSLPGFSTHPADCSSGDTTTSNSDSSLQDCRSPIGNKNAFNCDKPDAVFKQKVDVEYNHRWEPSQSSGDDSDCCKKYDFGSDGCQRNFRKRKKMDATKLGSSLFSELDNIFSNGKRHAKGVKNVALSRLKNSKEVDITLDPFQPPLVSLRTVPSLVTPQPVETLQPTMIKNNESSELSAKSEECGGYAVRPSNTTVPVDASPLRNLLPRESHQTAGCYDWLINNTANHDLPNITDDANPVYLRNVTEIIEPAASYGVQENLASGAKTTSESTLLGFVCFLKKLSTGIILVTCESSELLESLWLHPVLRCVGYARGTSPQDASNDMPIEISKSGDGINQHSVAAVIYLSFPCVENVPSSPKDIEQKVAGPPHIAIQENKHNFGFCSSLETLAKLNVVNKQMFPLPCDTYFRDIGGASGKEKQVIKGQDSAWKASMLTRLVFENGPDGDHTLLDNTECLEAVDIRKIQNDLIRNRPGINKMQKSEGRRPSLKFETLLTANQMAATSLKERLKEQRPSAPTNKLSRTSEEPCKAAASVHIMDTFRNDDINNMSSIERKTQGEAPTGSSTLSQQSKRSDFELVFLGTGSAEPSKFRGSSSILLQIGVKYVILLDAGEGTFGQLVRRFGWSGATDVLMSLQCVWLSHKHADHVLGVLSILHACQVGATVLTIIGPPAVKRWISEVAAIWTSLGCRFRPFRFLLCNAISGSLSNRLQGNGGFESPGVDLHGVLKRCAIRNLKSVVVDHCHEAYGLVIHGESGWSIVYSGDTRPCYRLTQAGRGCTLLIHEATFGDSLVDHAKRKRHSTVLEALDVGIQMNAQYVVLTHFSQRYPQVVTLDAARYKNVCLAFDGMVVRSSELEVLGKTLPFLAYAFSPSERPDRNLVLDPYPEAAVCSGLNLDIPRNEENKGKGVNLYPTHFQPHLEYQSICLGQEISKSRRMKGFRSSFDAANGGISANFQPDSKDSHSRPQASHHVRFAEADSESEGSDSSEENQ